MVKKATLPKRHRQATKVRGNDMAATIVQLDRIKPNSAKTARTIALFKSWLADESGYDEQIWPRLKKALEQERKRAGARRLFNG